MPKLLLKFNAAVIREIPIDRTALSVGRKPDNDIVIDNPAVSGHHCKIVSAGDTFYVEDLDSTNGTFVNEKRVMKSGLHHNDSIGIARHSLVFMDEKAAAAPPPKPSAPAAPKTEPASASEPAPPAAAPPPPAAPKQDKLGGVRVLKGVVTEPEFELKGLSTYIGKSDRVQIQIKGSGLFGSAPEVAASIHRKPEGYVLLAVEDGYPSVNGNSVSGQIELKDGDIIECGATTLQFFLKDNPA
ncbi:MAG: FHA domain-containing protein [Elusimicrobiota bacterium]